ncbi:MAG: hypothetical protein ACYCQI_03665 [Gammaproteobacteria bacterium]
MYERFKSKKFSLNKINSLGGCGGTMLARCISTSQNVILLSECNPSSTCLFDYQLNPYTQIKKWYPQLFTDIKQKFNKDDLQDTKTFCEFVLTIKSILDSKNQHLVIRDYNYIDYFGAPFQNNAPMSSSLINSIKNACQFISVVLVRHPLYQYNSLRSHNILRGHLTPELFLEGYHSFLTDFEKYRIIKYENIIDDPIYSISNLSHYLGLPFSNDFMNKFHTNQSVTGNLTRLDDYKISLSEAQIIDDDWIKELQTHPNYISLMKRLNYIK